MIDIPAELINAKSPYGVTKVDTNSFVFTTRYGIKYNVGFSANYMLTDEDGFYEFYITNVEHKPSPNDMMVMDTVIAVIEAFFAQSSVVMLYICDTMDHRQRIRSRLFQHWYNSYANRNSFTLINESVVFDEVAYFGSIVLSKDHPEHNVIVEKFHFFMEQLPDKIEQFQSESLE